MENPFPHFLFSVTLSLLFSVTVTQTILQVVPGNLESSDLELFPGDRNVRTNEADLFCESWRFAVETNDAGIWTEIPAACLDFVRIYMTEGRYAADSNMVAAYAFTFAGAVGISGDGKDVWIFDIDETLLSNLPYYADHGYGSDVYNETSFDEWVDLAIAPALPASLKLYKQLQQLGFTLMLLTGRTEAQRNVTEKNLLFAGYSSWERLLLRGPDDYGTAAIFYKSKKRAELKGEGFRIQGSMGDQWSDLLGSAMADRSFKLPNPMYYIE